jgi:type I restriction-modification system DNA methylase subunit
VKEKLRKLKVALEDELTEVLRRWMRWMDGRGYASIPGSFSLIRELVRFLEEMDEPEYRPSRWVVDEILSIVNGIDLAAIHNDLSFRARKAVSRKVKAGDEEEHRLFEKDPFIYFYEDFLKAYDPAMRKGRGVYYTPPPVVNFIVRAIDDILKDTFGIADGLAATGHAALAHLVRGLPA